MIECFVRGNGRRERHNVEQLIYWCKNEEPPRRPGTLFPCVSRVPKGNPVAIVGPQPHMVILWDLTLFAFFGVGQNIQLPVSITVPALISSE